MRRWSWMLPAALLLPASTVTPVYRTLQPNGLQCPPTCRRASVTVALSADE